MFPKTNQSEDPTHRPITPEQLADAARRLLLKKPDSLPDPDDHEPTEDELNEVVRVKTTEEP